MPLTENFNKNDIQRYLDNYKEITKKQLNRVKQGTFIAYITQKTNQLNLGGILIHNKNNNDYIILKNGTISWSVQKKGNKFYTDVDNDTAYYIEKINNNNSILESLKSSKVQFKNFNNIDNIINNLYEKSINKNIIKKIQKENDITDFIYMEKNDISYNDYIKYYDYENKKLSPLSKVIDIKKIKGIIISITLLSRYDDDPYIWKIIPDKYYIYRAPDQGLTKLLTELSQQLSPESSHKLLTRL